MPFFGITTNNYIVQIAATKARLGYDIVRLYEGGNSETKLRERRKGVKDTSAAPREDAHRYYPILFMLTAASPPPPPPPPPPRATAAHSTLHPLHPPSHLTLVHALPLPLPFSSILLYRSHGRRPSATDYHEYHGTDGTTARLARPERDATCNALRSPLIPPIPSSVILTVNTVNGDSTIQRRSARFGSAFMTVITPLLSVGGASKKHINKSPLNEHFHIF